ncbi:MAG: 16S rRNA (uracil(1498)-N(3))-methyltransferase, partial [Bdellovibrionales bacterium]|nr:16S rRNA (uracil(1498)-N(3))-methyltransferase [Bdellovibrionales bacterium]
PKAHIHLPFRLTLAAEEARHASRVLRLEVGAEVELFALDQEHSLRAIVVSITGERCEVEVVEQLPSPRLPDVTLLAAVVKPAQSDFICEKAAELGLKSVHFFFAERSQHPLRGERLREKLERLQRVRDAALKQSHSPRCTSVFLHPDFSTALDHLHLAAQKPKETRLLCSVPGTEQPPEITSFFPVQSFSPTSLENSPRPVETYIAVGPEGGFTSSELELALQHGYRTAKLGSTTLRSETAAVLASGLCMLLTGLN